MSDTEARPAKIRRVSVPTPEKTPKSRWRPKNSEMYSRNKRKARRNLGQEYLSDSAKKQIKARELGLPCSCKYKCREKLQGKHETIFNSFWDLGSYDLQNSYLFGCIEVVPKKRSYIKKQKKQESSRKCNAIYKVNVNSESVKISKAEFMGVHGLQYSRGRINLIVSQKIQGVSVPKKDQRGKHNNRPHQLTREQKQSVRDHINLIPKYQSHYSRADNLGKVYLNCDMTIARLYKEFYLPWCEECQINPVKESVYRKIFCTEFNIGFKFPKSDTCKTCDETAIKLDNAVKTGNQSDIKKITQDLNLHKCRATAMQSLLKYEIEDSKLNKQKCVLSFDLQQALPIPKLTTGPAFYCRKVWLYNLGIHDCTNGQGYMFLWTEDKAKRGADEIASVLLKYLKTKNDFEDLVIFTDNCPGQNKNWLMVSLWLQLVKERKFNTITHHFLVSGHTHLPSDRDFALIEKRHRKYAPEVYSPEGWYKVIKESNTKTPFVVTVMDQEDFLNFEPILSSLTKSARTADGENLDFASVYTFQFRADNTESFYIKHTVNGNFKEVLVKRKGRPNALFLNNLKKKYTEPIKIAEKKVKNVISLLKYIPPLYHPFFTNLKTTPVDLEEVSEVVE